MPARNTNTTVYMFHLQMHKFIDNTSEEMHYKRKHPDEKRYKIRSQKQKIDDHA